MGEALLLSRQRSRRNTIGTTFRTRINGPGMPATAQNSARTMRLYRTRPSLVFSEAKTRSNTVDAVTLRKPGQGPTHYLFFFSSFSANTGTVTRQPTLHQGNNPSEERITAGLSVPKRIDRRAARAVRRDPRNRNTAVEKRGSLDARLWGRLQRQARLRAERRGWYQATQAVYLYSSKGAPYFRGYGCLGQVVLSMRARGFQEVLRNKAKQTAKKREDNY